MAVVALKSEIRENVGKGPARALRREGKVPAIIYGAGKEEVKVATSLKELVKEYGRGSFNSRLYDIDLGKEKVRVIPRDVQVHPVTDIPLHADFLRVNDDTKVHVFVHVNFHSHEQSPGLKRGGVLSIIRREVELICRADSIPASLDIDLAGLFVGDSLHSHNITLPEGVEYVITDRDFTIATIVGRAAEEVEEEPEVAEGEEGAEGEATEGAEGEAAEGGEEKSE